MLIDLYLELNSLHGRHTVALRVELARVPGLGEQLELENRLLCRVEQVTTRLDGSFAVQLRPATPAQADVLLPQLLQAGWTQAGAPPEAAQAMR